MKNEIDMKIKTLWFNNAREFVSKKFDDFSWMIVEYNEKNVSYTSQQNGVIEWANRTIVECIRNVIHA